jgi:transcriptional regulator with XRE-family HTH domain
MSKKSFAALYTKLEPTPAYQAEKLAVAFLAELNAFMQAHGVSNAELARRVDVSPAYVTKLFRGSSNLTIETLTKFADAVGCQVHMHLANNGADVRWFDVFQQQRAFQREIDPGIAQFTRVMSQLKTINQEAFNDEKFAFAA